MSPDLSSSEAGSAQTGVPPLHLAPIAKAFERVYGSPVPIRRGLIGQPAVCFAVVSSRGKPKWVLPIASDAVPWALKGWRPYRVRSRVAWNVIRVSARMELLKRLPSVELISVDLPNTETEVDLGLQGGRMALYVGEESATHSCVAFYEVRSDAADCGSRIVLKIPLTEAAAAAIANEHSMLEGLHLALPGAAPAPLGHDVDKGLARQQYVSGSSGGRRFTSEVLSYLLILRRRDDCISTAMEGRRLLSAALRLRIRNPVVIKLRATVRRLASETTLPAVWLHGDFAPWNLRLGRDGQIRAIDWEHGVPAGLPLYDLVTFFLMQDVLFGPTRRRTALFRRAAEEYLDRLAIHRRHLAALLELSLWRAWLAAVERRDEAYADEDFDPAAGLARLAGSDRCSR